MKRILLTLILLLAVVPIHGQDDEPPTQIDAALADLSQTLDETVELDDLSEYTWERETFNSAAMGCPSEDGFYAQVLVDGYAFTLDYDGSRYDYRVSDDENLVVACGEPEAIETTGDTDEAEEAADLPEDDDVRPVVAIFPAAGAAGSSVQVIANDLPADARVEIGLGEEDSDYPTVETVTTTPFNAASLVLEIPEDAEIGSQWVVAVRFDVDDEIVQVISDAFVVIEEDE